MVLDLYIVRYELNNDNGEYGGGMLVVAARNYDDAEALMLANTMQTGLDEDDIVDVDVDMILSNVAGLIRGVIDACHERE